jgi:hypothetical protein
MSAASRWASVRPAEPSNAPNPGAGYAVGRVPIARPQGAMSMNNSGSDWHPTVVNLVVLIMLEMVAYAVLRYVFRQALGA